MKSNTSGSFHNGRNSNHPIEALFPFLQKKATIVLTQYLKEILPSLSDDWWQEVVVNKLSYHQQRLIKQRGLTSLASLDFAALLRILDSNWHQIASKVDLSREDRHFVKEMETVRNRWAHPDANGFPREDMYRDLDTLQRFVVVIGSDDSLVQEIRSAKASLLKNEATSVSIIDSDKKNPAHDEESSIDTFKPGQIVFLKSNPEIRGAVVSMTPSQPENRYNVFVDGEMKTFYESQLKIEKQPEKDIIFLPHYQFNSYLTALAIRNPGLSTLYSLNAARVDFIPYQFRPVLKFIRSERPRLLIADSVGVGKTIEAGLILRELQARRDIRSVLIICPRPLVTERKWEIEMKRFEERFYHLDGSTFRYCIDETDKDGAWPEQYNRAIIPYSLFNETLLNGAVPGSNKRVRKGLLGLEPPPRFDVVIVDEAHHIRNTNTYTHKAVRFFCDHAEAVLFLTATPIQLGNEDLYVLLNTLRPDLVIDENTFVAMSEPNPYINRAVSIARVQDTGWEEDVLEVLDKAAGTQFGKAIFKYNPDFLRIKDRLLKGNVSQEERMQLITDLENMHTFSGIISRTRRRDIGDFTIRKPETVVVEFTPSQRQLHDKLLRVQAKIFIKLHGNIMVRFMMSTIRRQAASCIYGLAPFLHNILTRHIDELEWDEADGYGVTLEVNDVEAIKGEIQEILEMTKNLDPYDPKLEKLRKILKDKQALPNNKVMVFSSFRHTLYYLYRYLKNDGFRVGLVHGGTLDEQRIELRNRFELDRQQSEALDVLLFSEVGCEGLDYQFCDCIVNYDLPWNPMRIEQRIGRIDRQGQKSPTVAIVNMITPETVDADIYYRCLWRIGIFQNAIGASEEILGRVTKEIRDIAENFTITDEERREKLQQLADNEIRSMQEQEDLEKKEFELFGIRLPEEKFKKDVDKAKSFWLSQSAISNLIGLYLQKVCGKDQEFILGEKPLKTLRLSQENRQLLLKDFQKLTRQSNISYREWENWLKGGNPHLEITFDADCASQNHKASFINQFHPLVKQAANSFDYEKRIITALEVIESSIPSGTYPFAIYQWHYHGVREDLSLRPVTNTEPVTERLIELLEKAKGCKIDTYAYTGQDIWDNLDSHHHKLWSKECEEHKLRTQQRAKFRRESLTTSHKARISLLQEQLTQTDNEKIQRMRQSQIEAAEADYARRIQDLDIAIERADITAQQVAYGILLIREMGK